MPTARFLLAGAGTARWFARTTIGIWLASAPTLAGRRRGRCHSVQHDVNDLSAWFSAVTWSSEARMTLHARAAAREDDVAMRAAIAVTRFC